jgi:hypothetical protein
MEATSPQFHCNSRWWGHDQGRVARLTVRPPENPTRFSEIPQKLDKEVGTQTIRNPMLALN